MLCGTRSFSQVNKHHLSSWNPCRRKSTSSKNPYSGRGLDKFSLVIAELDVRRQKILDQVMAAGRSQGAPIIRFMYSNTRDWVPIVVVVKDPQKSQSQRKEMVPIKEEEEEKKVVVVRGGGWNERIGVVVVVVVVVLVCMALFGRVFATCCTSVIWYMVPVVRGEEWRDGKRLVVMKKESFGRRALSGKKMQNKPLMSKRGTSW